MAKDALTVRQKAFCEHYVISLNASKAARLAGYAARSATVEGARLLANAKVRAEIHRLQFKRAKRLRTSADLALQMVIDVYEHAMAAGDRGPAIKAAELIGRHHGLYPTRTKLEFAELADDELDRKITRLQAATGRAAGGKSPPDRGTPAAGL